MSLTRSNPATSNHVDNQGWMYNLKLICCVVVCFGSFLNLHYRGWLNSLSGTAKTNFLPFKDNNFNKKVYGNFNPMENFVMLFKLKAKGHIYFPGTTYSLRDICKKLVT